MSSISERSAKILENKPALPKGSSRVTEKLSTEPLVNFLHRQQLYQNNGKDGTNSKSTNYLEYVDDIIDHFIDSEKPLPHLAEIITCLNGVDGKTKSELCWVLSIVSAQSEENASGMSNNISTLHFIALADEEGDAPTDAEELIHHQNSQLNALKVIANFCAYPSLLSSKLDEDFLSTFIEHITNLRNNADESDHSKSIQRVCTLGICNYTSLKSTHESILGDESIISYLCSFASSSTDLLAQKYAILALKRLASIPSQLSALISNESFISSIEKCLDSEDEIISYIAATIGSALT